MKTDLSKIMSVGGQSGLYRFVGQSRNGAIAEHLSDKHRTMFGFRSKISSLSDISIYTSQGEMKLQDVFLKIKEVLGDKDAPTSKAPVDEIKALFQKAVPDYDDSRFYVSHMKKVVDWYNDLKANASLNFGEEGEAQGEESSEDKTNE